MCLVKSAAEITKGPGLKSFWQIFQSLKKLQSRRECILSSAGILQSSKSHFFIFVCSDPLHKKVVDLGFTPLP